MTAESLQVVSGMVLGVATVVAWALADRRPEHRPFAWLLSVGLAHDVALHVVGAVYVNHPSPALEHLSAALFLVWPASIAGTALFLLAGKRAWPVAAGWAVAVLAIVVTDPKASTGRLDKALAGIGLAAILVAAGALVAGAIRRRLAGATCAWIALAIVMVAEIVSLTAVWRFGLFDDGLLFPGAHLAAFSALVVLQGGAFWRSR
jgi:hypothetical protein